ncbi:1-phosphatidylinositol 4:5-bisphosphate phosphodiesterase classes I and II-like protein [Leptotrombidium deliense]|uniref:1-phosphatidylinositol 4:5-bisphosphate phosphodiesterase classes I and II-like protein n=1 Tax=Leptotrombidium deliense TaxID=299467 RepID=A0A443SUI0_9ACAR|nr:1-phosphatidylinositol 4:5-bisphosphate phosphodiesterase classes I and II-like protein [Leptotrombidium deliense]
MASAKAGVHVVQLKPISVPKSLQEGDKFVKWDEDSTVGSPVILRVDPKGFFLYWTDQNKDTEFLEISSIRDEGKLRDSVNIGPPDIPLEEKTLTFVYGSDFVNVNFINFCCTKKISQEWTDSVLKMAYNLLALNTSANTFLVKAHTKIQLMTDREGKIPVKKLVPFVIVHLVI